jgi:hypothetical protein
MFDAIALSPVFSFDDSTQLPAMLEMGLLGLHNHMLWHSHPLKGDEFLSEFAGMAVPVGDPLYERGG